MSWTRRSERQADGVPRDRLVALYPDPSRLIRTVTESLARTR